MRAVIPQTKPVRATIDHKYILAVFFFMSLRQHASWYTIKTQEEMTTATAIPSDIKVSYTELGNIISLQVAYKLTILEKSPLRVPLFAFSPVELYVAVASIPEIRTMQSTGF